jgi:hypothetical protein
MYVLQFPESLLILLTLTMEMVWQRSLAADESLVFIELLPSKVTPGLPYSHVWLP